jgi:hypothetical protein
MADVREWRTQDVMDVGGHEIGVLEAVYVDTSTDEPCACRKSRPCWSSSMSVLVEGAAESVASAYVETGDFVGVGDGLGHWAEWRCLSHGLVRTVGVVMGFEFAQEAAEVTLVPDEGAIQEFVAAGLHPSLRDRVHARGADAAEGDLDAGVGEDPVEQGGELRVSVADQVPRLGVGIVEVHDQILRGLGDPGRVRVRGGSEDADAAGGEFAVHFAVPPVWVLADQTQDQ